MSYIAMPLHFLATSQDNMTSQFSWHQSVAIMKDKLCCAYWPSASSVWAKVSKTSAYVLQEESRESVTSRVKWFLNFATISFCQAHKTPSCHISRLDFYSYSPPKISTSRTGLCATSITEPLLHDGKNHMKIITNLASVRVYNDSHIIACTYWSLHWEFDGNHTRLSDSRWNYQYEMLLIFWCLCEFVALNSSL